MLNENTYNKNNILQNAFHHRTIANINMPQILSKQLQKPATENMISQIVVMTTSIHFQVHSQSSMHNRMDRIGQKIPQTDPSI